MSPKIWIVLGSLAGCLGVVLGAFGGHVLKEVLNEKAFSVYLIAVQYQMYHALALLGYGLWAVQQKSSSPAFDLWNGFLFDLPGWAFSFGILAFAGSLYALALTDVKILGMITPLGGLSFIAGWLAFAFLAWKA